jgi:hypothetical protein
MLSKLKVLLFGAALAIGFAGAATAQNADVGFNPSTGLQGFPALEVSLGTVPTTTGSTCAAGTLTVTGGSGGGKVATTTCTTLVLKLNWSIPALVAGRAAPALTGVVCFAANVTHPAALTQSATTYTAPTLTAAGSLSCTFSSATITAADSVFFSAGAF